jgi:hypothetical protein
VSVGTLDGKVVCLEGESVLWVVVKTSEERVSLYDDFRKLWQLFDISFLL